MNEFEEIEGTREAWKQAIDSDVIKATTKDWDEYSSSVQAVIEAEAKNRGLWEKVLSWRGENTNELISKEGNLEGYVCERCNGTYLNFETGRCVKCGLPSDSMGYCIKCDKFWSLQPGQMCPEHGTKLARHKAAMALLRLGNDIFDHVLIIPITFAIVIVAVALGFVKTDYFENMDSASDYALSFILFLLYYFVFEIVWQRTLGKFITGTKVITADGKKPTLNAIAIRTLIRFVPFEAFSFLGERVYGWHDRWSGTYVIKAKRFEKKTIDHNQVVTCPQPSSVVKTPEKTVDILSVSHRKVEVCENCGRTIGKLEQAYVFKNHIVCKQCYEKLKKQI